jgi:Fur family ferric uptake transcriptional regulator
MVAALLHDVAVATGRVYCERVQTAIRPWTTVRQQLKERGLRWTPQRRLLLHVLSQSQGHVTAAELIERCREADPQTTPSTVYRTLDVLEDLGVVRHGHAADGREEFHVLPADEHGHLYCRNCGQTWEIGAPEVSELVEALQTKHQFTVDVSHLTIVGICRSCRTLG